MKNLIDADKPDINRIEPAQAKWQSASDAQKRMLIAQDIIDRLQTKQMTPNHGWGQLKPNYDTDSAQEAFLAGARCECCALGGIALSVIGFDNNATLVKENGERVWYNTISLFNRTVPYYLFRGTDDRREIREMNTLNNKLHDLFGADQLRLIEWCYEQGGGVANIADAYQYTRHIHNLSINGIPIPPTPDWVGCPNVPDPAKHAPYSAQTMWDASIISQIPDDATRMIAIMTNIIENDGTFCPGDKVLDYNPHNED